MWRPLLAPLLGFVTVALPFHFWFDFADLQLYESESVYGVATMVLQSAVSHGTLTKPLLYLLLFGTPALIAAAAAVVRFRLPLLLVDVLSSLSWLGIGVGVALVGETSDPLARACGVDVLQAYLLALCLRPAAALQTALFGPLPVLFRLAREKRQLSSSAALFVTTACVVTSLPTLHVLELSPLERELTGSDFLTYSIFAHTLLLLLGMLLVHEVTCWYDVPVVLCAIALLNVNVTIGSIFLIWV